MKMIADIIKFIKNSKEKPKVKPILVERRPSAFNSNPRHLIKNSVTGKVYIFLNKNKNKAFLTYEVKEAIKDEKFSTTLLNNLAKKDFIYKSKFKIHTGKTFNSVGYLFSCSEKAIWKKLFDTAPKEVKQALGIILSNPNMIFCIKDLENLTGMRYGHAHSWFNKIFIRSMIKATGKTMLQKRSIKGLRTFYFHPDMSEETFQRLYKRYYQKKILAQESLSKLKGMHFEEFATWTFCEYMKLKGLSLELKKVDREPCDFIANVKINIGDLMVRNPEKQINVAQFVISCKNWNLDRSVSGNYVLGMAGALSRGLAFNNEQIFAPCRSIGVILCTKANHRAWRMSASQGILIIDLWKLTRMYEVVKKETGKEHKYYEKLMLKIDAYKNRNKS